VRNRFDMYSIVLYVLIGLFITMQVNVLDLFKRRIYNIIIVKYELILSNCL